MNIYTGTASTGQSGTLTLESILKAGRLIDEFEKHNRPQTIANMAAGLFNPFGAIRFKESPLATRTVPKRKHKKRRGQTAAYHRRIQKKWTKRFGMTVEQCAFFLDGGQFGMGSMLVVSPAIAKQLRAAGGELRP